jgi:hypothetical protein
MRASAKPLMSATTAPYTVEKSPNLRLRIWSRVT